MHKLYLSFVNGKDAVNTAIIFKAQRFFNDKNYIYHIVSHYNPNLLTKMKLKITYCIPDILQYLHYLHLKGRY